MQRNYLLPIVLFTACIGSDKDSTTDPAEIEETEEPTDVPVLYLVSMMHAEESVNHHQNENIYGSYATALELQRELFSSHGAKIDFGPDWTFIEGVRRWDSSQLSDHIASGHGIHTHAHESQYDLGEVNRLLADVGVTGNPIANGGFLTDGPDGTNWVGYIDSYNVDPDDPIFTTIIGYKNPQTQIPDTSGACFRPSHTGDWSVEDTSGSLLYLGSNSEGEIGAGALDFAILRDWIDSRLDTLDSDRMNTLYWHDSLHKYGNEADATTRREQWEIEFEEYFDPLVADGRIQWATFEEMAEICAEWE